MCLACWRNGISMTGAPPRDPGWPEEHCAVPVCGRRTNHGIYVNAAHIHHITHIMLTLSR